MVSTNFFFRNILLDQFYQAKIADFGLSISLADNDDAKNGKLPIKWTAPEGLFKREFSSM